ncbi:MAG TPA: hypothetical protein VNI58_10450, partial [Mariprofundaceae bacterium]|nr:hypothetical protein [Mariprofundaceae bacterium]
MNNMKKTLLGVSLALTMSGCATIVGDSAQVVSINSKPDMAEVTITDERGANVHHGQTPVSVTLEKSDGSYFGGKTYNVHIEKAGYKPVTFALKASPNGWYIGGNLIFGGLIGWLIVDPFSGKMY